MKLTNEFAVPMPPDAAWPLLLDVERMVPCMPGAELIERLGPDTFKGRVSVRLGPVALAFEGTARFASIDDAARRAVVEARGADRKGRGGANATVAFALEPHPTDAGASRVLIDTDLQLSGSVAQYGRASGLIAEVARELVGQFATNLSSEVAASAPAESGAASSGGPAPGTVPGGAAPARAATAISGIALAGRVLWSMVKRMLSRLLGRS